MTKNKTKKTTYGKKDKLKKRIKHKLKKTVESYSDDPVKLKEMDDLVKELTKLDTIKCEVEEADRFKRYFSKSENVEDMPENAADICAGPLGIDEFEHIVEIADDTQIEETIDDKIGEIKSALKNSRVVIVQGNTGCGKTTKIPRMLMDEYRKIVCTQPRRLAAISVARKVAGDVGCDLGSKVGYTVRFDDKTSSKTRLKFATDGVLIKEIYSKQVRLMHSHRKKKNMKKIAGYDLIVIDEAHERTVNIDFLLGFIKRALQSEKARTRLLIMSATLNTERFVEYFQCPLVTIKHRSYNIEYFYLKYDCDDYLSVCIRTAQAIIERERDGDVLVFLTGQDEIERAHFILSGKLSGADVVILKLFSTMPPEEQDLVFQHSARKIILSTNIAETSITIENIKFVVDSGVFKAKRYYACNAIDSLDLIEISKAQAKQRAGRAGRTQPGKVFRIYSYSRYLQMADNPMPEILRSKLHSTVLSMKSLGITDVENFDFIDAPSLESINQAELFLYYIRAIDKNGVITDFGRELANIPLEPETAISLVAAKRIGCLNAVATISAFLEYQTPFLELRSDHPEYRRYKSARSYFSHPKGDFYSFLVIFYSWEQSKFSFGFLRKNFLNIKTMVQILNVRAQILRLFPHCSDTSLSIERAFCTGFFMKAAKISENGYKTIFGDVECYIHPRDGLLSAHPKYVVFYELFSLKNEYMGHCLEVLLSDLQEPINRFVAK
ncbi:uncharacterized protein VICG_00247 [Vittaforma corneae ATCC 50505]|uniref:ATP-dependent helicase HrpA n=1 Tax=Vittaforma corneae (strain ATCC 50505) TaxID=993615 RepID=L2GRH3_VITCO|nr:uncharacterized protein VICG_00247 [Vittaforma corneae ATCC 50505]ELA42932.1 hypothetical protein VICG_00247 [Vittaforma corneae ATCC 50505]